MKITRTIALFTTLLAVPALSACGGSSDAAEASADSPKELIVATGNMFPPFVSVDDSGNATGYDVEVLKAVDEKLPQYEFTYEPMEMTQVLVSLEQNRADIAAHQWVPNPEREKTYLFAKQPYTDLSLYIASAKGGEKYQTLKDLEGKTVVASAGTIRWNLLDEYNKNEAATPIKLEQLTTTWEEQQVGVDSGTYDAVIGSQYDVDIVGRGVLQKSDEPVKNVETFFVYRKDETQIQEDIDGALKELTDDGTLKQIAEDVLGEDLSPKAQG